MIGRPRSLRGRLALVAVCASAIWVCALTGILNVVLGAELRGQADALLRTRADAAALTVTLHANGTVSVREPPNDAALDASVWIFQGTRALERPRATAPVQAAARRLARGGRQYVNVGGDSPFRLYAQPISKDGTQLGTIVTVASLDPYQKTARSTLLATIALAVLFVVGVYFVTRRVVDRALQPVVHMSEQAAQWSAHDVTQRFGDAARPTELRELATNLDTLLNHIGAVLRHEQQMAAELSHELKTPLSLILAENELLTTQAAADSRASRGHEVIAETAERMNRLLDTLLADAAQRITEAPGRCALEPAIRAAVAETAGRSGADITTTIGVPSGLEVGVGHDVVQRILTPLLSNAGRYARSRILVRVWPQDETVTIVISDDGPGLPVAFRDSVFEPGSRADPTDDHPGPGLGLALARRLARSSGGDISVRETEVGAAFAVSLPAG
jgi:signal transduction histidine kinase